MKINKEYLIEILIILAIIIGVSSISYSAYYNLHYKKNLYNLVFEDVDGIIKGSPVKFMGVIVGHVSKITYKDKKILAEIYITKKNTIIPDCSNAKVEFSGIVGSKSIEIMPPKEKNCCHAGIISNNPLRINEFFNSIQIYNRALEGMENGLKKFSNENTDFILSKITKNPDIGKIDKSLEGSLKFQIKFNKTIKKVINSEENMLKGIDSLEEKIKK